MVAGGVVETKSKAEYALAVSKHFKEKMRETK